MPPGLKLSPSLGTTQDPMEEVALSPGGSRVHCPPSLPHCTGAPLLCLRGGFGFKELLRPLGSRVQGFRWWKSWEMREIDQVKTKPDSPGWGSRRLLSLLLHTGCRNTIENTGSVRFYTTR